MANISATANGKADKYEKTVTGDIKEFSTAIQQDVSALKNDVMELGRHVRQNNAQVMGEIKEAASKQFDKACAYGKEGLEKAETMVREKPAHAVGVAFVAGLLASFLFGRR